MDTPKTEKDLNKLNIFNTTYEEKNLEEVKKEMRKIIFFLICLKFYIFILYC